MTIARNLAGVAMAGLLIIISVHAARGQEMSFDVASVKPSSPTDRRLAWNYEPGRFTAGNVPLVMLIALAYDLPFVGGSRISGGPEWARSERFDVEGKAELPSETASKARETKMKLMLQSLLKERFKLVLRRETKEMPIYTLVVAKNGPKLQRSSIDEKDCPQGRVSANSCHVINGGMGRGLHGKAVDLSDIVLAAGNFTDRPLIDKSGVQGLYEVDTEGWVDMRPRPPRPDGQPTAEDLAMTDPTRPTLFMIFDRLGLKMESTKGPIETFIIEQVEKPAAN